jgi:DNA repair exonuclease SbcCD ATPase subunit
MIPIRVYVEGFMSYRDAATLDFEGAPLWMLTGPNGAGKSTVFDAITFALYGLHRGGKQDARELINHSSDSLVVEFDFSVGANAYRVRRTLSRKGRSSFQALQLTLSGKSSAPRPVAETDSKAGFDRWIQEVVGLDESTFTASVLLQQGRSDALLEANPSKRHEMLAQIVDLSAYEQLHSKTDNRRKEFETQAKYFDAQLQGLEPVDEGEIERLATEAENARQKVLACQQQLQVFAALRVHAERWNALQSEQADNDHALQDAKVLFEQAQRIEQDAARRKDLDTVLPPLQRIVHLRSELEFSSRRLQELQTQCAQWQQQLDAAQQNGQASKEELARLQNERVLWQQKRDTAQSTLVQLGPAIFALQELERLRSDLAKTEQQLHTFPADLDEQVSALLQQERELAVAQSVLPYLQQFAQGREEWLAQRDLAKATKQHIDDFAVQLAPLREEQTQLQAQFLHVQEDWQTAQENATRLKTIWQEAHARLKRLDQVDGQAECFQCGQPLTPAHLATERERLQHDVAEQETTLRAARTHLQKTQRAQDETSQRLEQLKAQIHQLECDQQAQNSELKAMNQCGKQAQKQLSDAYASLPFEWRDRIYASGETPEKVTHFFISGFPSAADIAQLKQQVTEHRAVATRLETLRADGNRRAALLSSREAPAARVQELESQYPPDAAEQIRTDYHDAQNIVDEVEPQLQLIDNKLAQVEAERQRAEAAIDTARHNLSETQTQSSGESARHEQLQSTLSEIETAIPAAWQETARTLDSNALGVLQHEQSTLSDAPARLGELEAAQANHQTRLTRVRQIEDELAKTPEAARCAVEAIDVQVQSVRGEEKQWTQSAQELEGERNSLLERKARRAEWDEQYHVAEKQARLHKQLAELLGRDNLQRYLLQQAEASIVANANHVLDRISNGTLRLELRRNDDEANEKSKTPKALDLIAYNTMTGGNPLPVYLLSGSQRFRVAVSLALGIGQFAGHGAGGHTIGTGQSTSATRSIESVIIDEGFGSLDQEGRREIIDELHNLKNVLRRIILVSHQEEFADAFPNRYQIELKNGTSTAHIVQES